MDDQKLMLKIQGVSQSFGKHNVLYDVNLDIIQGQFLALVGESGCGKSTLLRATLGTDPPKSGQILVDNQPITQPTRDVGIVYQQYLLYDFLTAEQNVALGPKLDKSTPWDRMFRPWFWRPMRKNQLEQARYILKTYRLGEALDRYPSELSGGMQQRVALAQAIIMKPKVILLDEPFGALDANTREDLQTMLLQLYSENINAKKAGLRPQWTVIIVTHELDEAFYVADRVVALSRNWHENTKSGRIMGETSGSTVVWDQYAPVYEPESPKDFALFSQMKADLRSLVLDNQAPSLERGRYVQFWNDLKKGIGSGVAITRVHS
jgi:NitT/TauT family transport system ATP-binding protein